ncbi:MAG: hypothetical protein NVSMB19_11690 [Vulcanimicrobiaceae bacterium]
MTPLWANASALGLGFVIALGLAGAGALRVVKLVRTLKARGEEYKRLPVRAYVEDANRKLLKASRRVETAPALLYRMNAALADLANARAKLVAIATSPSALWRLGELAVTGK